MDDWRGGHPMDVVSAYAMWRRRELGESPRAAVDRAWLSLDLQEGGACDLGEWR